MPKFQVNVAEVHTTSLVVEAENEQEAQAKAENLIMVGCYEDGTDFPKPVYDHTLEQYEWPIIRLD